MTRISSAFNLLKRVGFALLLLVMLGEVYAQPAETIWSVLLGRDGVDFASDITPFGNDNYIVSGSFYSSPSGGIVLLMNDDGDTMFTRNLADSNVTDIFNAASFDGTSFVFVGSSFRIGFGTKAVIGRMTNAGHSIWLRHMDSVATWIGYSVAVDTVSKCLTVSGGIPFGGSEQEAAIFQCDSNGVLMWTRYFGGESCEHFEGVVQSCDGGYVAAGIDCLDNPGSFLAVVAKVNANGDSLWSTSIGPLPRSWAHNLCRSVDCGYLVVGECEESGYSLQFLAVKIDSLGNEIWTRTYGGLESERCFDVVPIAEGGYLLCGSTRSYGSGNLDTYLVRIDENGDTLWTSTYGSEYSEYSSSLVVNRDDEYILAGRKQQEEVGGDTDLHVFKLGAGMPVSEERQIESVFSISSTPFPNPCGSSVNIQFLGSYSRAATIEVVDILGRRVYSQLVDIRGNSRHTISINSSKWSRGMYFYTVTGDKLLGSGKLIIVK